MINLSILRRQCSDGMSFDYIYFWGHRQTSPDSVTKTCLSQWYCSPFAIDGQYYETAEHWMMAKKAELFGDTDSYKEILKTKDPRAAKSLGRKVSGFEDAIWNEHARKFVVVGNQAKFAQNDRLRDYLLSTADSVLVEASPNDSTWGIGLAADDEKARHPNTWEGQNLLGFALMDVRAKLRNQAE